MMLAEREEINVFDDDHLAVVFLEECVGKHLLGIHFIAPCEHFHGLGHSHRRFEQSLSAGIFSEQSENLAVVVCQLLYLFVVVVVFVSSLYPDNHTFAI